MRHTYEETIVIHLLTTLWIFQGLFEKEILPVRPDHWVLDCKVLFSITFPGNQKKKSTFQSFESNCPGKHHHFSAQKLVLHLGNISSVLNHWYPQKQSFFQSIFTLTQKSKSTQLTPELSRHVNQSNRT